MKQLGEACTFTPDARGAYDDCAKGLACVGGSCQRICVDTTTCTTCSYVPGYPPELRVCL